MVQIIYSTQLKKNSSSTKFASKTNCKIKKHVRNIFVWLNMHAMEGINREESRINIFLALPTKTAILLLHLSFTIHLGITYEMPVYALSW